MHSTLLYPSKLQTPVTPFIHKTKTEIANVSTRYKESPYSFTAARMDEGHNSCININAI